MFKNVSIEKKTAINITLLQGLFHGSWAFICYCTIYLQEMGVPASSIGMLNAVINVVGIFAAMFWGMFSDKINSIKKTFIIVICGLVVTYTITPLLPEGMEYSIPMFFAYYTFVNIFKGAAQTLEDNLAIRTCTAKGINYGVTRSLGSLTFAILSLVAVTIVASYGVRSTFFIYGMFGVPIIVTALFAFDPKSNHASHEKKQKLSLKPLFKNYYYVTFLVFIIIYYAAVSADFSFLSYLMEEIGIAPSYLGSCLAVRAFLEIPMLVLSFKLRAKIKLKYLIMTAGVFMATQCIALGTVVISLPLMLVFSCVFGIGNGLFIGSAATYLLKLAPEGLKASAQSLYTSVCAVSAIIGNFVGGIIFEQIGGRTFYIGIGAIMLLGSFVLFVTTRLRPNLLNPGDELN